MGSSGNLQLGRWGLQSTSMPHDAAIGVDSMILSLRVRFDPKTAGDLRAEYELRLDGYRFRAVVDDGQIDLVRGPSEQADAVIGKRPAGWTRWSRVSGRSLSSCIPAGRGSRATGSGRTLRDPLLGELIGEEAVALERGSRHPPGLLRSRWADAAAARAGARPRRPPGRLRSAPCARRAADGQPLRHAGRRARIAAGFRMRRPALPQP